MFVLDCCKYNSYTSCESSIFYKIVFHGHAYLFTVSPFDVTDLSRIWLDDFQKNEVLLFCYHLSDPEKVYVEVGLRSCVSIKSHSVEFLIRHFSRKKYIVYRIMEKIRAIDI